MSILMYHQIVLFYFITHRCVFTYYENFMILQKIKNLYVWYIKWKVCFMTDAAFKESCVMFLIYKKTVILYICYIHLKLCYMVICLVDPMKAILFVWHIQWK